MSARIDHAARAAALVAPAGALGTVDSINEKRIAAAQVHATLALVEQQRIANMQTERSVLLAHAAGRNDLTAASMLERAEALGRQIREGLGL